MLMLSNLIPPKTQLTVKMELLCPWNDMLSRLRPILARATPGLYEEFVPQRRPLRWGPQVHVSKKPCIEMIDLKKI